MNGVIRDVMCYGDLFLIEKSIGDNPHLISHLTLERNVINGNLLVIESSSGNFDLTLEDFKMKDCECLSSTDVIPRLLSFSHKHENISNIRLKRVTFEGNKFKNFGIITGGDKHYYDELVLKDNNFDNGRKDTLFLIASKKSMFI